jgi:hypothetical protein
VLRLLEDECRPVVFGDFKLVAVSTVEFDQASLGNLSQRQDVSDTIRTVPHLAVSWNCAAQFGHYLASLGVNRQTASNLMDVAQQIRVGECIGDRLAVKKDPLIGNSSTVDTVFDLKRCTPVFLIFLKEEEVGIVIFVISFLLDGVKQLLCCLPV